jgi:hypothetical protein
MQTIAFTSLSVFYLVTLNLRILAVLSFFVDVSYGLKLIYICRIVLIIALLWYTKMTPEQEKKKEKRKKLEKTSDLGSNLLPDIFCYVNYNKLLDLLSLGLPLHEIILFTRPPVLYFCNFHSPLESSL